MAKVWLQSRSSLNRVLVGADMTTLQRICIKTETFGAGAETFTLERGKEYITSPERNGEVHVFSTYWFWAPVELFAGAEPFTTDSGERT
jgi:hypothetical protein